VDDKRSVRIVMIGRILDGFDLAKVKADLAEVTRLDPTTVERLLTGAPHVVKQNVDEVTADTYLRRLRAIGVECTAEPEYLALEPQALAQVQSAIPIRSSPKPAGAKKAVAVVLAIIMGVVFVVWLGTIFSSADDTSKQNVAANEAKCKVDLQCWGDKHLAAASVYCKSDVERLGQYSARWTDGTLETKVSRFKWLDKEQGTITFVGDKIEFQNGFGAYQNHIYECDLDPATNKVLEVRARPGRL
jgi:hypothetical protein